MASATIHVHVTAYRIVRNFREKVVCIFCKLDSFLQAKQLTLWHSISWKYFLQHFAINFGIFAKFLFHKNFVLYVILHMYTVHVHVCHRYDIYMYTPHNYRVESEFEGSINALCVETRVAWYNYTMMAILPKATYYVSLLWLIYMYTKGNSIHVGFSIFLLGLISLEFHYFLEDATFLLYGLFCE